MSGSKSKPKPSVQTPVRTPAYRPLEGLLLGDQTADRIFHLRDLNGDGDAGDDGERISFFDASNQSGLAAPADNIFAIHQAAGGIGEYVKTRIVEGAPISWSAEGSTLADGS